MPSIRIVRYVVDHMKRISPRLVVSLHSSGKMVLGVSNLLATVDTHFRSLDVIGLQTVTGNII